VREIVDDITGFDFVVIIGNDRRQNPIEPASDKRWESWDAYKLTYIYIYVYIPALVAMAGQREGCARELLSVQAKIALLRVVHMVGQGPLEGFRDEMIAESNLVLEIQP
jgi:hypothetical protein